MFEILRFAKDDHETSPVFENEDEDEDENDH